MVKETHFLSLEQILCYVTIWRVHRYSVSLKANLYLVYTRLGCAFKLWVSNVIFPLWDSEAALCSLSTCSLGILKSILTIQSLLWKKFEIWQVTANSSSRLSVCSLTMNVLGHTIICFMQLCAAVFHLLIVRLTLVISFRGSGYSLTLCFLPVHCPGTNGTVECLLNVWWSALEWMWAYVPFTSLSSVYKISGFYNLAFTL